MQRTTTRTICVCWYLYSVVLVVIVGLSSVQTSTATYNPAYHPQNPAWRPEQATLQQEQLRDYQLHNSFHWEEPRGGSTMVASESLQTPQQYEVEELFEPPKVDLKHISMALRLTSEWNRRLLDGANRFKFWKRNIIQQETHSASDKFSYSYGNHPINVHPSRPWHPPIPEKSPFLEEEELTLFHAKDPRDHDSDSSLKRRGVARWGPDLLPYLEHVVELLGVTDGVEIPLAMIYLDRACSVETPRSNGVPPCPFCTPRTVHRLSLAAFLLATQAVHGPERMEELFQKVSSFGIPHSQLKQMVDWMQGALGDTGLLVTVNQMKQWSQSWDSIFFPNKRKEQWFEKEMQRHEMIQHIPSYFKPPDIKAVQPYNYDE